MRSFENDKPENHRVIIKKNFFLKIYKSKNLSDRKQFFNLKNF